MELAGVRHAAARAQVAARRRWACPGAATITRRSCRAASSSGWRSRAPWPTSRAVLLADEPTGNLDTNNGQHVVDILLDVNKRRGTTLVLVTHDLELAARAHARIALRDGHVVDRRAGRAPAGHGAPDAALAPAASEGADGIRPPNGRPGGPGVLATPDVLLRVRRGGRRRHRRAALGDSVGARGARCGGAHADGGRHHGVDQPAVDPGPACRRRAETPRGRRHGHHRGHRDRDDGQARGRVEGPRAHDRAAGRRRGLSVLRPRGTRGRAAVRARL